MSELLYSTKPLVKLSPAEWSRHRSAEVSFKARQQIRTELPRFVASRIPDGPSVAITLTLKQRILHHTGRGIVDEPFTMEAGNKLLGCFLHRLNRYVYGTAYTRFGRTVGSALVIERAAGDGRYHVHGVLGLPEGRTFDEFRLAIVACWNPLEWAREISEIKPVDDAIGWAEYICKQGTDAVVLT